MERDFLGLKWEESPATARKKFKHTVIHSSDISHVMPRISWTSTDNTSGGVQCSSSPNRFSSLSHHQKADQLQRQTTENFHSSSPTYFPVSYNSFDYTVKTTPNLAQRKDYNREWKDPAPDNSILLSRNKCNPFPTSIATSTQNTGSGSSKTAPTKPYFGGMSNMERSPSNFSHQMGHAVVNQGTNAYVAANVRNKAKAYEIPAHKLTIFYGDDVYVYDDISPQQAEVIMSMAKFGSTPSVGEMASSDSQAEAKPLKTNSNSAAAPVPQALNRGWIDF